jgi:hypothetical protein
LEHQSAAPSTFTLIRGMRGGGGGMRMGGMRMGGMRAGGMRMGGMRGMRGPRMAAMRTGPRRGAVVVRRGGRGFAGGRRFAGGRYWRNGRWWYGPAAVGFVGGIGGGSCYWNCRNTGYGPGFCRAYAGNFC